LARCEVNPADLRRVFTTADLPGSPGVHVVAYDRTGSHARARMFAPDVGVVEDPATGSAAVALAVFLVERGVLPGEGEAAFTIDQGVEMGRPSRMDVAVRSVGGAAVQTSVGGRAALVARGELVALP
jgi:trans-2,3-dihydro-3-hydroxyanthranilate isomerase